MANIMTIGNVRGYIAEDGGVFVEEDSAIIGRHYGKKRRVPRSREEVRGWPLIE